MKSAVYAFQFVAYVTLLAFGGGMLTYAQDSQLKIHVTPKQAYVFVDGHAISEGTAYRYISVSPGDHKVDVANYGYNPASRTVTTTAGKTADVDVSLTPVNGTVSGPFGAMTIEGAEHDAVLLNGKTPDFFVGNGGEFDHDWWWKQELVVPPGKYQVTVLRANKELWSGPVDVPANQRVVVDIPKGVRKTVAWPRGEKLGSIPRFTVGTASATVAVAKPTAALSVTAAQINCGDSSQLKWNSTDAPKVDITPIGSVATSGEQSVQPKQTTAYQLTALGPGGTATSNATVDVNTAVQADLGLSPGEIHYKRVGNKVVEDTSSALNWKAANASTVSIDPFGAVDPSGSRTVQVTPKKTDPGAIDETVTYTLNASNGCGGSETKTATLHIVGSIEPPVQFSARSVFFPTDRPRTLKTEAALLASEQQTLKTIADDFKKYLADNPDSHLVLVGHADQRGVQAYNRPLSERRAQLVKRFLTEQGVPEASLETQGFGKEKNLSKDQVKQLLEQNADLSAEERQKLERKFSTMVLAYNRRVDLNLTPAGPESAQRYPVHDEDFAALVDRNGPKPAPGVVPAAKREKIPN